MKILTILGTRPEFIRLSLILEKLDKYSEQIVVHTGQNYDKNLNDIFFSELGMRKPDYFLGATGSFGEQIGKIIDGCESIILKEKPDKFLVLGDTNSSMGAICAKRLGVPVYHMEAGNRCNDDRVPEEVNRKIIDHSSDILMPYTQNSKANLLREGIPPHRIYVTGNPIYEVIRHFEKQINASEILEKLDLAAENYFLVTMHRAENVDREDRLLAFLEAFDRLQKEYGIPIIISTHPRTRTRMKAFGVEHRNPQIKFMEPFGFFDFIMLEKNARCLLSDSGTVQEEACIFGLPSLTIRDVTERPETLEVGSNVLTGADVGRIVELTDLTMSIENTWEPPQEYLDKNVSDKVIRIVLSNYFKS